MSTTETLKTKESEQLQSVLLNLINGIEKSPEKANATFKATSTLSEGFLANINIRNFEFLSDEPEDFGGKNAGPNPVEYVLGAFAACQEIVIKAYATVLDIDLKSVEVEAYGDLDLHGFLNLSDQRPGFTAVRYKTIIETNETDRNKLKTLEDLSVNRCPVLDIINRPVQVEGHVEYRAY
jgi:uncharacterized OsmC-like protein